MANQQLMKQSTLLSLVAVVFIVTLDQLFKVLAVLYAEPGGIFTFVKNTGITFGLFPGANAAMVALSILAALALGYVAMKGRPLERAGFLVILSGVIGNGIDRAFRGYVVDYISLSFNPFVFNFADMCIVGGIVYLLFLELPGVQERLEVRLWS